MNKFKSLICLFSLLLTTGAGAESLFWTFDDTQKPVMIPPECEAKFDEVHGGVFMPTVEELLQYGQDFLKSNSLTTQQQGAYCILGAALQDNAEAQFLLAQIYENGKILPQDDLSAYKWSFIAALNGKKEAESFTLLLEQYLSTAEMEKATSSIQETRMRIQENTQKKIDELKAQNEAEKEALGLTDKKSKKGKNKNKDNKIPNMKDVLPDVSKIFNEKDRMK